MTLLLSSGFSIKVFVMHRIRAFDPFSGPNVLPGKMNLTGCFTINTLDTLIHKTSCGLSELKLLKIEHIYNRSSQDFVGTWFLILFRFGGHGVSHNDMRFRQTSRNPGTPVTTLCRRRKCAPPCQSMHRLLNVIIGYACVLYCTTTLTGGEDRRRQRGQEGRAE